MTDDAGEEMTDRRDRHFHQSKGVNIVTLLAILGVALSQLWIYGDYKEDGGKSKEKLTHIDNQVKEAAKTHVIKIELDHRLATQEYKIQAVADDVKEVKESMKIHTQDFKEQLKLIQQILREMPRKSE